MKPTERFSDRVENYVRFRPDYPPEVVELMRAKMNLNENSIVADIGSGTGIFARRLLETGCTVYGVEPNAAMRAAGEHFLADFANFKSIEGTSENTSLPAESVNFVTAAQAFHWFDKQAAKTEFRRILRPGGFVVLIWNVRRLDADAFSQDYENLLRQFGTDYKSVVEHHGNKTEIDEFLEHDIQQEIFANIQTVDFMGLKGRLLSSSYIPPENSDQFPAMIAELERIFERHQNNGTVKIYYDTKVFYKGF